MVKLRQPALARPVFNVLLLIALLAFPLTFSPVTAVMAAPANSCQLNSPKGNIQHIIAITFDNVHFTRDLPNVPSDLEQMPHLLNFITSNGVMFTNHHTPLISHTATDILATLTGVYGDRHGVPVSNSFRYFKPDGTTNTGVSFAYWTAPLFDPSNPAAPTDTLPNMLTADGKNAPAPWVPYTRAGCNFGGVATANMVLENTAIDIPTVFGSNSPEATEAAANSALAQTDFVGIGIHCGASDTQCNSAAHARPDLLPDEPGGYTGFNGVFGAKYVDPLISPNGLVTDINGNVIKDSSGNPGFPGFDGMSAAVTLGYVAAMQENGVPVTYAYISDAHDKHPTGPAYGPGEAGYVAALQAYDAAFAKFFDRLAADGITPKNTLFVFSADENDHFAGTQSPTPAGCDGVNVPCTYVHTGPDTNIGEVNTNLTGLLATQQGITTPFTVHSDSAPTVYITGNPGPTDPVTRAFERASARLTATNPYTSNTEQFTQFLADPAEMKILHMLTADPARTPTLTLFANPDYFLFHGGPTCTVSGTSNSCVVINSGFAWNHGDVSSDITHTWMGMVGPGIDQTTTGINTTWSDHTDVRPTMMTLLGLKDDYNHDGRVLVEALNGYAIPAAVKKGGSYPALADAYKQLNAPLGEIGLASLRAATKALVSGSVADDSVYANLETQIISLGAQRDTLAAQMISLLEGAAYANQPIDGIQAGSLIKQADALIDQMQALTAP